MGDAAAGTTGGDATGAAGSSVDALPPWAIDGGGGPPTALWTLTPDASPATVTFTVETAAKVTKEVPLTGGTLKATAKDGTTFELTIPGDALFAPETIVMTPVTITAHPFSAEPAWGVQLLPDGLTFNKPLTLIITPPGAAPSVKQQVPFGWAGTNNQVVLANPDPKDARLSLKLLHFSSYAYATATLGTSASLAGVRHRIGGSAEDRINSAVAEYLGYERQKALLGVAESELINGPELEKWFAEYDKEVVQVRVAAAGTSCAAGRLALQTVLGVQRQKQLLGYTEGTEIPVALIDTVEAVCVEEEWILCRDHHIIQRLIPLVLGMERQHQLLGGTSSAGVTKALGYIYKCFQFELDVTSGSTSVCDQWNYSEPVQGQVKLKLSGGVPADLGALIEANVEGVGTLFSQSYAIKYAGKCTGVANIVRIDPRFVVSGLSWSLKEDPTVQGKGEIKDLKLMGEPAVPNELMPTVWGSTHDTLDLCGDPPDPPFTNPEFNWWSIFVITMGLNPAYFSDVSGWYFDHWMVNNDGGALLAKKVMNEMVLDGGITYTAPTTLLLTHKPGP